MHEEYAMTNKLYYLVLFGLILAMARIIPHPPNFTPILASAIMAPLINKNGLHAVLLGPPGSGKGTQVTSRGRRAVSRSKI